MVDHFSAAFGTLSQLIMAEYDTRHSHQLLPRSWLLSLTRPLAERELLWRDVPSETEDAMQDQPTSILAARPRHHP